MRAIMGVPNQVQTKRLSNSFLLLRSAWESNLGEGIDADGVTFDEAKGEDDEIITPGAAQEFDDLCRGVNPCLVRDRMCRLVKGDPRRVVKVADLHDHVSSDDAAAQHLLGGACHWGTRLSGPNH